MRSLLQHFSARSGALCLTSLLALGSWACTDDGTSDTGMETSGDGDGDGDGDGAPGDGDGDAALSYAADIQPIWTANCTASCHMAGGSAAFLDLSGDSYANVVGTLSNQATDKQLIEAGNAANSYLIAKLRGTQATLGGTGSNMPSGAPALDDATITMVEQWADEGALP